jgi:hypothetical protein
MANEKQAGEGRCIVVSRFKDPWNGSHVSLSKYLTNSHGDTDEFHGAAQSKFK